MGELSCSPCFGLNSFSVAGALRLRLFSARIVFCACWALLPWHQVDGRKLIKVPKIWCKPRETEKNEEKSKSNYVVVRHHPCVYQMCEKWSKEDKKYDLFSLIQCWCYGPLRAKRSITNAFSFLSSIQRPKYFLANSSFCKFSLFGAKIRRSQAKSKPFR